MLTITNNFHNTSANVRAKPGDVLSLRRVRTVKSKLCSIKGCICGGFLGERGKQEFEYEVEFDRRGDWLGIRIL